LQSLNHSAVFLAVAFACEGRFEAALFARRNIEGVSLHFADNVFLLHFALESTESAFERLVIAKLDFCHLVITCLSLTAKDIRLEMLIELRVDAMKGLSAIKENPKDKLSPVVAVKWQADSFQVFLFKCKFGDSQFNEEKRRYENK
jgi:hypothetical protein